MDHCCLCGREIGRIETKYRPVKGWEKIRAGSGSTTAIWLREVTSTEIACTGCIEVRGGRQITHAGQMELDC